MDFLKKAVIFAAISLLVISISGSSTHERPPNQKSTPIIEAKIKEDVKVPPKQEAPIFPLNGDYEISSHYGFNNGYFSPYTVIKTKGTVVSILAGEVTCLSDDTVTIKSQNTEIEYTGVKPAVRQNETVNAGQKIGDADEELKIKGTKNGMLFDILFEYFPDKSAIALKQKNEEQQKIKYQEKKREMEIKLAARNSAGRNIPADAEFGDLIFMAAKETGIAPEILYSIAYVESGFNPNAVSEKGAMGIMQLMPGTAKALGVKNPFDPKENILAGAKYFKYLLERFDGDLKLALAAYNAGPNSVEKYNGIPPFDETQNYVKKVSAVYNRLTAKQSAQKE